MRETDENERQSEEEAHLKNGRKRMAAQWKRTGWDDPKMEGHGTWKEQHQI